MYTGNLIKSTKWYSDRFDRPKYTWVTVFYKCIVLLKKIIHKNCHWKKVRVVLNLWRYVYKQIGKCSILRTKKQHLLKLSFSYIVTFFMPPKELWEAYSNRTVSPSVPLSCPVHISYILWGRDSKFGVWIHLGMAECRAPFLGHCDLGLDLWHSF